MFCIAYVCIYVVYISVLSYKYSLYLISCYVGSRDTAGSSQKLSFLLSSLYSGYCLDYYI
jgi:hypothetical protein